MSISQAANLYKDFKYELKYEGKIVSEGKMKEKKTQQLWLQMRNISQRSVDLEDPFSTKLPGFV